MAAPSPAKRKPAVKKATKPRKASVARAGVKQPPAGLTNGDSPFQPLRAPEPMPVIEHPYGNIPVYIFKPNDGSAPIVFPKITTLNVTAKFMWKIYALNELFQSFEWMDLGKVPRDIQERVVDLPQAERARFWGGWFNDVTNGMDLSKDNMGPPGES